MKRRDAQLAPDERADSRDPLDAVLKECLKQLSCGNQSAREKILEVCQARLHDLALELEAALRDNVPSAELDTRVAQVEPELDRLAGLLLKHLPVGESGGV